MLRALLVKLHRWAGLGAGLFLVLVGFSGALLALREEIEPALAPALWFNAPEGPRISADAVVEALAREEPAVKPITVRLPRRADRSYEVFLADGRAAHVDAYRGKVLGLRRRDTELFQRMHRFHTQLLLGKPGAAAVAAATALLFGLTLTGIVLGWPKRGQVRKALTLRLGGGGKRLNRDLHTVVGLYAAPVLGVLTFTGLFLYAGPWAYPAVERLAGSAPLPRPPPPPVLTPGQALTGPSAAIAVAERAVPDAETLGVTLPMGKAGAYTVYKRFPEDRTPLGRTRVQVHAQSGEVLFVESTRAASAAQRLPMNLRGWHTGDAFGLPGRALYAAGSAWSAGLAVTGLLMWWWRRRQG